MSKSLIQKIKELCNQPSIIPQITLTKDNQSQILSGKQISVIDKKYKAKWLVKLDSDYMIDALKNGLKPNYLIIDCLKNLNYNYIRQKELKGN